MIFKALLLLLYSAIRGEEEFLSHEYLLERSEKFF